MFTYDLATAIMAVVSQLITCPELSLSDLHIILFSKSDIKVVYFWTSGSSFSTEAWSKIEICWYLDATRGQEYRLLPLFFFDFFSLFLPFSVNFLLFFYNKIPQFSSFCKCSCLITYFLAACNILTAKTIYQHDKIYNMIIF